tara:strand:- start:133 stop:1671 length:1539 start_codon:yes stop_codon:yes gene_type:complete
MNLTTLSTSIGITIISVSIAIFFIRKAFVGSKIKQKQKEIDEKISRARKEFDKIISKAQEESKNYKSKLIQQAEDEIKARHKTVAEIEKRVTEKENNLIKRESQFNDKLRGIDQERQNLKQLQSKQEKILVDLAKKLENVAEMSKDDAEKLLITTTEKELKAKLGKMIKDKEQEAKKIANRKATEIITTAIQRTAVDHVAAITTSTLELPDDDMKGRVIGKEGRNIRAFESISGVDVIIDDTPGCVVLSAFDPIRRELARLTMKKLLEDGRIHPSKIEEEYEKSKKDLNNTVMEYGEKAADEIGLEFHPKIVELIGKLHFRSSYGQNILKHSIEATHLAGIIASQLGVNVELAKRGTMLHDIGKALDFEREGTHTVIGKEVCEQYGESKEIQNCIMAHHEEEPPETIEAIIVMIADAVSSVRPGARRESLETHVKRLEKLEAIANEFDGVIKAYAIQAGREVRVIVNPQDINDDTMAKLSFDIAKKIENQVDYPGEVKISVVREVRSESYAK